MGRVYIRKWFWALRRLWVVKKARDTTMAVRQRAVTTLPNLIRNLRNEQPFKLKPPHNPLPSLRRAFSLYDQINLIDNVPEDQLRFQGYSLPFILHNILKNGVFQISVFYLVFIWGFKEETWIWNGLFLFIFLNVNCILKIKLNKIAGLMILGLL